MAEPEDIDPESIEGAIEDAAEVVKATETLTNNLREFLEAYVDKFTQEHPEVVEGLQEETAQSALSDSFDETLNELEDRDEWSETDLLTVGSLAILLAISLGGEGEGGEEEEEEDDHG